MKKKCRTIKGLLCGIIIFLGLMNGQAILAQQINITGKVTNVQSNEALIGVTILEKGTTNGALTDALGNYSIKVTNANSILVFSFVGLESQEMVVAGQKVIDVAMKETASMLNEVVVTGYGTQRRSDLTGAISVVKVDETKDIATGSLLQAIQGTVPGVYIRTTGDPGGSSTINIRGVNTLGNTNPLYIIDGVPTIDPNVLQNMNQNSIESMQVLKDASATSIYGSRASNGVIIVTTKSGKGGINVELRSSYSIQKFMRRYDVCNTDQYGRVLWQGAINDAMVANDALFNPGVANHNPNNALFNYDWHRDVNGVAILDGVRPVQFLGSTLLLGSATPTEYGNGNPLYPSANTNWQDEVFQTGLISQNSLTLSGSTDRTSTLVDLAYYDEKGTIITTGFKKVNVRVNNSINFFNTKLKIGENVMLTRTSYVPTPADAARSVIALSSDIIPMMPVYKTDGTFAGPLGAGFSDRANPVHMADVNKNNRNLNNGVFGNLFVEIKPIKNLLFRSNIGLEYGLSRVNVYYPKWQEGSLGNSTNYVNLNETESYNWTWSNTLTYQLVKGRSRGTVIVGTEAISNLSNSLQAKREQFAVDDPDFYYLNAGTGSQTNGGSGSASKLLSYFGNVNYIFADKYMLTGTVRYDGSSRFGQNNRFGLFPSVGASWVINKEEFMKGIKLVSNLKLRAGYGVVGNQAIGDYSRFQIWRPDYSGVVGFFGGSGGTAYDINGVDTGTLPSGFRSTQAANDDLKWESTSELNLGIDFGVINQKVTGSFDYFSRKTKNILTTPPILGVMGEGASQTVNGATMQNKGWEFTLGYTNKAGDFGYNLGITLSHFADKITYLPPSVVRNYAGNTEQTIIGHSRTSVFGYKTDGLFQSKADVDAWASQPGKGIGRIRYQDLNNDGKIDQLDQTWLGTQNPKLLYGVSGGISYKGLSLSFFVIGVQGVLVDDTYKWEKNSFLGSVAGMNKGLGLLNAWTPQNTSSTIPLLSFNNNNNETRFSDYRLANGSYLKLQTLRVNYDIPSSILSSVKLQSVRVYCSGENLLLLFPKKGTSAFTGPDPETPSANFGGYPRPVKFTFGADIKF